MAQVGEGGKSLTVEVSPEEMNWRRAICAEASCMATRSGLSLRYVLPRWMSALVAGSSKCP
jgi:hypothetical protein